MNDAAVLLSLVEQNINSLHEELSTTKDKQEQVRLLRERDLFIIMRGLILLATQQEHRAICPTCTGHRRIYVKIGDADAYEEGCPRCQGRGYLFLGNESENH